jgi:membrane-associated phospholipid phosphatase
MSSGTSGRGVLVGWLVFVAAVQLCALTAVWWMFVRTAHGQTLDAISLAGTVIGRSRVDGAVQRGLDTISALSVVLATCAVGFVALARRRVALAVAATLVVAGANLTTQVLKYDVLDRPDLGVDDAGNGLNSLPSGHTTVAASVALAAVLVLPPRLRGVAALVGAGYAAFLGVATLSAGWHRPSDAVAAVLVVGVWAAVAGVLLVVIQPPGTPATPGDARPVVVAVLAVAGVLLLGVALLALGVTDLAQAPVESLGRRRLFVAYAGGAAGIAGTTCVVFALVLATLHRVVPGEGGDPVR